MSALLLSFTLILISVISDKIQYEQHTANNYPISANQYPWMVSLRLETDSSEIQLCGGSLIGLSPCITLTAAYCFESNAIDGTLI